MHDGLRKLGIPLVLGLALMVGTACFDRRSASPAGVDVPLHSVLGLPIIELRVGDSDRMLSFLIDTGFDVSVIDVATADRLGLAVHEQRTEAQPGGTVETGTLAPQSLHIDRFELTDVELTAMPVGAMSMMLGRPFDGILGHDVLRRYVVDIDYPAGRVRFADPTRWRAPADAESIAVEERDGEPLVDATVVTSDGREVTGRFKLDTGSLDVIGMNLNFVRDNALVPASDSQVHVGGVAVGGGTEGRLVRVGAFVLGSRRSERPLVGYTVDSAGFEERDDAGTIGVRVLGRSRLVLDYPHERILFVGPTLAPMPEDLGGMLLVSPAPAFDELRVAIVASGGPADEAGLQAGDRIVSIGERTAPSLSEARLVFLAPGALHIVHERDGVRRTTTLNRRPLLPR